MFPPPSERTPEQQKIASAVNRALGEAIETFCESLDTKTRFDYDEDEVKSAVSLLAPDFVDDWEEYVDD